MISVIQNFDDWKEIRKYWHWQPPWGVGKGKQGYYNGYDNMKLVSDGIQMECKKESQGVYSMSRLFWDEAPMGYGKYSAIMTVPPQASVTSFVLYTRAYYHNLIRTILPEVDIAEYSLKNMPEALNVALHRRYRIPKFTYEEKYEKMYNDIKLRHKLDYKDHRQKSKQFLWDGSTHTHSAEITPHKVEIFLDDISVFRVRSLKVMPAFFTPTFGNSIPTWIEHPDPKPIVIHKFLFEQ